MQLIILGTSATVPTKNRNHSGYLLTYKAEGLLFDCGEGTQRQLKQAGISFSKVTRIFLSHWHGDHMLGLPGLLQSMAMHQYTKELKIYGPPGSKTKFKKLLEAFESSYPIEATMHEIKEGKFLNTKDFYVEAYPLSHRTKCYGYRFVEKDKRKIKTSALKKLGIPEGPLVGKLQQGKTITFKGKKIKPEQVSIIVHGRIFGYISDTRPNKNCYKIAKDADILLCESTYSSEHKEKAEEYFHMTAVEAAQVASQSNTKKLILTHFSARYKDESVLEKDARTVFDNTMAAKDFMKITF
ncbi:ribonuclease Z [Candidatus Woesearchaeota archaeon]|nr:ribonuclease Z [Candidatus Woesearchaeota archaeon]